MNMCETALTRLTASEPRHEARPFELVAVNLRLFEIPLRRLPRLLLALIKHGQRSQSATI